MNHYLTPQKRKVLNNIKMLRKEQIKELDKLKNPLIEDLRLLELTLKGQYNIEAYVHHSKQIMKYLKQL
jgi:hypothetical protein